MDTTSRRGLVLGAVVAITTGVLAGCGGSGVQVEGAPTQTASQPSASPTATPVTTGFGSAQPAVDTVVAMMAAYNKAVRPPLAATPASFDQYLVGQAKSILDNAFAKGVAAGIAARGTPDGVRITGTSLTTGSGGTRFAVLTNCPLISATDPATAYHIKTGKPDADSPASGSVPRPWAETIKLFQANGVGPWKITYIASDSSRTCHG